MEKFERNKISVCTKSKKNASMPLLPTGSNVAPLEHMTYCTQVEHNNHYTTDMVYTILIFVCSDYLQIQSNLLLFYFCFSDSSTSHKFENIVMRNNEDGAIFYQNIGEINPSIYFDRCWIEGNGLAILNLTSPPVINFNIQNTLILNFQHSLVSKNKGGILINGCPLPTLIVDRLRAVTLFCQKAFA
jgi:hypothetical protein